MRRWLLALFALGALGTGSELLLLGHTENLLQWQPVVLCGLALVACALVAASRWQPVQRAIGALAWLFVASGCTGLWQHYQSNVEFELEMEPGLSGLDLFTAAARGATPFLAPGAIILLGLLALLYASSDPENVAAGSRSTD
ncbi:MAG: hypothetical protein K8J08_02850 [Thermoanaerobaculia bacterium]|nr:hypothetical protein [Thermoanaerobaculia bacterium]